MEYTIQKTYQTDGSIFSFTFVGETNMEKVNIEEKGETLDNCFRKMRVYTDTEKNIAWLRTILRDFEETRLQVSVLEIGKETQLVFENKKLNLYETKENMEMENVLNVSYSKPLNFQVFVSGENLALVEKQPINKYEEKIKDIMNQIFRLENISPIYLQKDDEILYEIYKLFYEEEPNFNDKDINIRFETMFLILNDFYRYGSVCFKLPYEDSERFISLELEQAVERLAFFIENYTGESTNFANDYYKLKIKCIGENIKKYTNNQIENLKKINSILDARYCMGLLKKATVEDVANRLGYSIEEVNDCFQLMRTINKQISEDN